MIYVRSASLLALFLLFFSAGMDVKADEKPDSLVFSQILGSHPHKAGANILKKIYASIGIDVRFITLPARRSLEAAGRGETDGEIFRIKSVGSEYPDLVRIPTPLMTFQGYAYTLNGSAINRMDGLDEFRVGIVRGILWAEKRVESVNVVQVENNAQLLEKLLKGGIDVAITTGYNFEREIQKKENVRQLITRGKPLLSFDVFHYLNRKYESLVDDVDREIQKLHQTGEIAKLGKLP